MPLIFFFEKEKKFTSQLAYFSFSKKNESTNHQIEKFYTCLEKENIINAKIRNTSK